MTADELRNELGSLIWKTATNLVHGGKVSPVQFMDFMLGSLFYRFISEDVIDYCNNLMRDAGVPDPDYVNMPDKVAENARGQITNAKGFFILPSHLFINVANKAKTREHLDDKDRAEYGKQVMVTLATILTEKYGKGFDFSSLYQYMKFYHCFPEILDAVSPKSAKVDAVSQ